jgi:hypothetical protein
MRHLIVDALFSNANKLWISTLSDLIYVVHDIFGWSIIRIRDQILKDLEKSFYGVSLLFFERIYRTRPERLSVFKLFSN